MSVPTYLPYYIFAGGIAIIASALVGLRQALAAANWTEHGRTPTDGFSMPYRCRGSSACSFTGRSV
jgi:hypothetical protein